MALWLVTFKVGGGPSGGSSGGLKMVGHWSNGELVEVFEEVDGRADLEISMSFLGCRSAFRSENLEMEIFSFSGERWLMVNKDDDDYSRYGSLLR